METNKKRGTRILVPSGVKIAMFRELGVGRATINRALNGAMETEKQRALRVWALEHGGVEVKEKKWVKVDARTWKRL